MPQVPEFAGRALNEWTRGELEQLASRQRRDPPKIRELIDWMKERDLESMSGLSEQELFGAAKDLRITVYGSALDVLSGGSDSDESAAGPKRD